jgi:hypothetical protein
VYRRTHYKFTTRPCPAIVAAVLALSACGSSGSSIVDEAGSGAALKAGCKYSTNNEGGGAPAAVAKVTLTNDSTQAADIVRISVVYYGASGAQVSSDESGASGAAIGSLPVVITPGQSQTVTLNYEYPLTGAKMCALATWSSNGSQ